MKFYEYVKRHKELSRITKITNQVDKSNELTKFIEDELAILRYMDNPLLRSQALTYAQKALSKITVKTPTTEEKSVFTSIQLNFN